MGFFTRFLGMAPGSHGTRRAGDHAQASPAPPRLVHVGALDGIRGLAVLAVMAFHAGLTWIGGGFLGVDAFFVLSGYLITALLLVEHHRTRTIRLPAFWARRARRLLPAMLLVLVGVAIYAKVLTPRGALGRLRGDALATLGYVANWHFIFAKTGYFDAFAPTSPLRHMWSLAVEEQFYLVWPLIVYIVLRTTRSRAALLALTVTGVVASVLASVFLFGVGANVSRIYYGTDTRAHVILIGATVAMLGPGAAWVATRRRRAALIAAGVVGTAFTAWAWTHVDGREPFYYRGGSFVTALAVAIIIANVVSAPTGGVGRALSLRPLQAVGRISYGLYLWHWPTFLVLNHARTGLTGVALLSARMAATFAFAFASYRLVEQPIRQGRVSGTRLRVAAPAAVAVTAIALVLATVPPPLPADAQAVVLEAVRQNQLATAHADPNRPRILLVGDSVAWTLWFGIVAKQAEHGAYVTSDFLFNCGISRIAPPTHVRFRGETLPAPGRCSDPAQHWGFLVGYSRPDVLAIVVGHQEVLDRQFNGGWAHLGDADLDAHTQAELERLIDTVIARGTRVALLTSPYFGAQERPDGSRWPEDDPARVDRLNRIIRRVAARHPDRVAVVDLNRVVSPEGHYTTRVDGVPLRSDGVHFVPDGSAWVAERIMGQLVQLGRPGRDARLSAPPTRAP